jgi:glyoxylase-like metal-dependent hydrolase (beta-lactamase superfamily II)
VLIDPGDEVDELLAAAFEAEVQVQRILLTHAHVDHVTGVAAAKEALDVPVHLHRDDLFLYEQAVEHGRMFGPQGQAAAADRRLLRRLPAWLRRLRSDRAPYARPLPRRRVPRVKRRGQAGPRHLFVGRHAFRRLDSAAPTLPGGDYGVLLRSITGVLFPLGDDAVVHPGHGRTRPSAASGRPTRSCSEYVRSR